MSNQEQNNSPSAGPENTWEKRPRGHWSSEKPTKAPSWHSDPWWNMEFLDVDPAQNPHQGGFDNLRNAKHEELYSKDKTIGRGGQGAAKLYAFKQAKPPGRFVIKSLEDECHQEKGITTEISMLLHLNEISKTEPEHPNLLYALHAWHLPEYPARYEIVLPYLPGGDLSQYKRTAERLVPKLPEALLLHWYKQMASAINFLHEHDIVHQDLKPANVMISLRNLNQGELFDNIKIIDLGLARFGTAPVESHGGTPQWAPPEYPIQGAASDIFTLGAIMQHLATPTGKHVRPERVPESIAAQGVKAANYWYMTSAPFEIQRFANPADFDVITSIQEARSMTYEITGAFKPTGSGYSPLFECMVYRALDMNPDTRITAAGLVSALTPEVDHQTSVYREYIADLRKTTSRRPMLQYCWGDIPPGWLPPTSGWTPPAGWVPPSNPN